MTTMKGLSRSRASVNLRVKPESFRVFMNLGELTSLNKPNMGDHFPIFLWGSIDLKNWVSR